MRQQHIVPDSCTKIWTKSTYSSLIYHNKYLKMYAKVAINAQIWHRAKCHFIRMSKVWYLITVPTMNKITLSSLKYPNKHSIFTKNVHNYSNLAQNQILFYIHKRPMVPVHSTQCEENPSSHGGGMCKDGLTNRWTEGMNPFVYTPIPFR